MEHSPADLWRGGDRIYFLYIGVGHLFPNERRKVDIKCEILSVFNSMYNVSNFKNDFSNVMCIFP